ncbi:hypothetical protein [Paenibacillus sp. FSL M7-1046]
MILAVELARHAERVIKGTTKRHCNHHGSGRQNAIGTILGDERYYPV